MIPLRRRYGARTGQALAVYHAGLSLTAVMLAVRGVTQVVGANLSRGADAAVSQEISASWSRPQASMQTSSGTPGSKRREQA